MVKNPLTELQEKFSIIDLTGQWYVLDNDQIAEAMEVVGSVKYYKRQEAKLLIERYIEAKPIVVTDDQISDLIADFNEKSKHSLIRRIRPYSSAFYSLKLLAGHGVVPREGQFETLLHLLYRVICNGNRDHFDYLFRFIAHMLQKPEEKPDVAIIMIGGQGTGKGMFYRLLKRIWPYTMLQVHDVDDVIGRFTGAIERSYGIWMDEALFYMTENRWSVSKHHIREEIRIEEKFEPKRTIRVSSSLVCGDPLSDHFKYRCR